MTESTSFNRNFSGLSKSDKILDILINSIRDNEISIGSALPSINVAACKFGVARKTVVRVYEKLKEKGFVESKPRKGYYVVSKQPKTRLQVLLIIHSFDAHFQLLYNEFRNRVSGKCDIEVFFHHYNIKMLDLIVSRNLDNYDLFIISSFNHPRIQHVIGRIPLSKVLIISRNDRIENLYNSIVQNFYRGTYDALLSIKEKIERYNHFILSFAEESGHSDSLKSGFLKFCDDTSISHQIVNSLNNTEICKGCAYLVIDDADLIKLLKICKTRSWIPGKDVGVISYNETPLKEVIRDGITVVSCNFRIMAAEMADFILNQKKVNKVIPISVIIRNSL